MDPDDDYDMLDLEDHEAGGDRPAPTDAWILPFSRRNRLDSRLRMELGDQLCALFVEVGVRPTIMRDIQASGRLVHMWRGMPHDMYNLMWHVVRATTLVMRLRRTLAHYKSGQDTTLDRQSVSGDASYSDHNHGSDRRSPRVMPDE